MLQNNKFNARRTADVSNTLPQVTAGDDPMESSTMALIVCAAFCIVGYVWYATIISRRNRVLEALSSVDVSLKRRRDLVPNLLKVAQRFLEHEEKLLSALTAARAMAAKPYDPKNATEVATHLEAEQLVQTGLGRLFAVAENYPELRSADIMREAQDLFTNTEDQIAAARRFYNSATTDLNSAIQFFPGFIFAFLAGAKEMPFFQISDSADRLPLDASQYLK